MTKRITVRSRLGKVSTSTKGSGGFDMELQGLWRKTGIDR